MAVYLVCDICKKRISQYSSADGAANAVTIGNTYEDKIGSIDTCRNCREKIEGFIFKMMEENKDDSAES